MPTVLVGEAGLVLVLLWRQVVECSKFVCAEPLACGATGSPIGVLLLISQHLMRCGADDYCARAVYLPLRAAAE
jgi:hypothetical protein